MAECAWIVANIASSKSCHVEYIVQLNAPQKAFALLDHVSDDVKDNAIWILANLAGDSFANRDMLLEMGITSKLNVLLNGNRYQPPLLSHMAWLMSNLCRGKPYPDFHKVNSLSISQK